MNQTLQQKLIYTVTAITVVIIALLPFHAFLTIWLSSIFGHYTAFRLWKEFLLLILVIASLIILVLDRTLLKLFIRNKLVWLIVAYALLQLVIGIYAKHTREVTTEALAYGWLVDLRFLFFFLTAAVISARSSWLRRHWQPVLLAPAIVVVVFGLLEATVLPRTFLTHFGYGPQTIMPYETINHDQQYIRILSTLRGANPLGAYLVVIVAAITTSFLRSHKRRVWWGLFGLASLVALFFSFSRSAWIGASLAVATITLLSLPRKVVTHIVSPLIVVVILLVIGGAVLFSHSVTFTNIVFHTSSHSSSPTSSDSAHVVALKQGLADLVRQPFGRGPGTAGPASVYNDNKVRLAENFFIQIGQEVGWLGLLLFVVIQVYVGGLLYKDRSHALSLALLASLIGITFVNVLSHAWADDTLSYIWWGLAGVTLSPSRLRLKRGTMK